MMMLCLHFMTEQAKNSVSETYLCNHDKEKDKLFKKI